MYGRQQRKEDWEPAEHARRMCRGVDGKSHILVKNRLEIASQTVDNPVRLDGESSNFITTIINRFLCKENFVRLRAVQTTINTNLGSGE